MTRGAHWAERVGTVRRCTALAELEALVSARGYVCVQLLAEDTNPRAVSFYRREGYARQGINLFRKHL